MEQPDREDAASEEDEGRDAGEAGSEDEGEEDSEDLGSDQLDPPVAEAAESMDSEAERLEERADRFDDRLRETREDWERKQEDPSVPGAEPDENALERD